MNITTADISSNYQKETFAIIGAGISGLVLALLLSRSGYDVVVYEKRKGFNDDVDGRSINLTISGRGLSVLDQLGLKEMVIEQSVMLHGRIVHAEKARDIRYKYGTQKSHVLYSIRRSQLINILLNQIAQEGKVSIFYGLELINIDKKTLECHFLDAENKTKISSKADCVIGADGAFSAVRSIILKGLITNYQQKVFDWGYKEYHFNSEDAIRLGLSTDYIHMWPKDKALLVAIPNTDQTFSVIFTAPLANMNGGINNFDHLVRKEYKDIVELAPSFLTKCGQSVHNFLVSIKVDKWHLEDKIVLVGDACHATYPFYGQGMNSALEDAALLHRHITSPSLSRADAFLAYELTRKENTNVLHQLSETHLHQITKSMASSYWQAKDMIDYKLARFFPKKWIYEYEMIAHSNVAYLHILEMLKKQKNRNRVIGVFLVSYLLGIFIQCKKLMSKSQ